MWSSGRLLRIANSYYYASVVFILCTHVEYVPLCLCTGIIVRNAGVFGEGFGRVHLDNLNCSGSELRLQDCPHSAFEEVTCRSFESDVGVICPCKFTVRMTRVMLT